MDKKERLRANYRRWWERHGDEHREKRRGTMNRAYHLTKKYGITLGELEEMEKKQHGLCAICGKKPRRQHLSVDHDHMTGRVRGLLCESCNLALGHLQDSPELLQKAIEYLKKD